MTRDDLASAAIFLGDGKGRFTGPQNFGAGFALDSVVVGDVDADGIEDLTRLVYRGDAAEISGSGCPRGEPEYTVSYPQQWAGFKGTAPVVADFDRNGIPDIALGSLGYAPQATASVLIGLGNGEFVPQRDVGEARGVSGVAVADLNADGKLDIVSADQGTGTLSVYHGDGAGGFGSAGHIPVGKQPMSVAAVDVNQDARIDLLALDYETKDLTVLLAREDGSYQITSTIPAAPTIGPQDFRYLIASADFDRNGTIDLAVPNVGPGIALLVGDGNGGFTPGAPIPAALGQARSIQALELNDDGIADLATTNAGSSPISVLLGRGDGTFELKGRFAVPGTPLGFSAADVNHDGRADLIVADYGVSKKLSLLIGGGDGSFEPALEFPWTYTMGDITTADLDGDGIIDVLGTNGPEVWMAYGMRLRCADPRETYNVVPNGACMLEPRETGQEVLCR
jgi:hypothetical protein